MFKALKTKQSTRDEYYTPAKVWECIKDYLPKDKMAWEGFYGDGRSVKDMQACGINAFGEDVEFYKTLPTIARQQNAYLLSNPPFSTCEDIMEACVDAEMPFALLLPRDKIANRKFMRLWDKMEATGNPLQIITMPDIYFLEGTRHETVGTMTLGGKSTCWDDDGDFIGYRTRAVLSTRLDKAITGKEKVVSDCYMYCWKMNLPRDLNPHKYGKTRLRPEKDELKANTAKKYARTAVEARHLLPAEY
jgi:hypothetical protein